MDTMTSKLRALALAEPIFVVGMGASGHVALDLLREAGYDAIGLDERLDERRIEKRDFDDPQALPLPTLTRSKSTTSSCSPA